MESKNKFLISKIIESEYAEVVQLVNSTYRGESSRTGWTTEAGSPKTLAGGAPLNYGYMWWPADRASTAANHAASTAANHATPTALNNGAFSAVGIFGQAIYINPREKVVIVQWSAHTKPAGGQIVNSEDAFRAVAAALH